MKIGKRFPWKRPEENNGGCCAGAGELMEQREALLGSC